MNRMKSILSVLLLAVALWMSAVSYVSACDHDDEPDIEDVRPSVQNSSETVEAESPHASWADDDH